MKTKSVIVIGAGIGGLTAAIHLANCGLHVTVLEKNSCPGGRCDHFSREGHQFDTGSTLFVMPLLYEAGFTKAGTASKMTNRYESWFETRSDQGWIWFESWLEIRQQGMDRAGFNSHQN